MALEDVIDLEALGVKKTKRVKQLGQTILRFQDQAATDAAYAVLQERAGVEWVSRDSVRRLSLIPNDPWFAPDPLNPGRPYQWGPWTVGLPMAWDITVGVPAVKVAILDTGLDASVLDLASGRITDPYSVPAESTAFSAWQDRFGHGTGTAGVAAAIGNNATAIAGAAWGVQIMPVKISESGTVYTSDEIEGIVWAVTHGAKVINISAGYPMFERAEQEAVTYALSRGVTIVAAAGNNRGIGAEDQWPFRALDYPAAYHGVIAVGATDEADVVCTRATAGFESSMGWELDLVAPGDNIVTFGVAHNPSALGIGDGTSYSAPLVAGTVALALSVDPSLTPARLDVLLKQTARDIDPLGFDQASGFGRLDAGRLVARAAAAPGTPVTIPPLPFSDRDFKTAYVAPTAILAARGIITGYTDGTFRPNNGVMRQQFAKMIVLTVGKTPTASMVPPFRDVALVPTDLYPDNYIALAARLGIVQGYLDRTFRPFNGVTRAQAVTMVVRAADSLSPGLLRTPPVGYRPPFGLFNAAHDPAAAKASWNGLLDGLLGVGPTYDPMRSATRAEVAAILEKLLALQ